MKMSKCGLGGPKVRKIVKAKMVRMCLAGVHVSISQM